MSEKTFQQKALDYLNGFDDVIAENVSGNANQSGRADINGCARGQAFKIELKDANSGYEPTEKQLFYLEKWAECGCLCGVCYSLDDICEMLDPYLNYCAKYQCIKCVHSSRCKDNEDLQTPGKTFCKNIGHPEGCNPDCKKVIACKRFQEKPQELSKEIFKGRK